MTTNHFSPFVRAFAASVALGMALLTPTRASADDGDPPSRVARLAFLEGSVSFQPGGTDNWVAPPPNRPLTTGDQLWSDRGSRVELQLDGSLMRMASNTAVSFLNLSDNVTQVRLSTGTLVVHVRRLDDSETYEIDTPNLAFSVLRPGSYRIMVDESGTTTTIRVRDGLGEVTGGGYAYTVDANSYDVFSGTDQLVEDTQSYAPQDDSFDAWSASRENRRDRSESARYVSPDVVGYEDLDEHGSWNETPEYGHVWFPRDVDAGWAPYRNGHWAYIAPWGYTWVDDQSWGFAPFHYGRWISVDGRWGWIPSPPPIEGAVYVRPVYAPALVAWVGVGAAVAWFALGPREVFLPSYPVSRGYVRNINVSNTTIYTATVNNIYNTTIVNNTVTNVTYVNRSVPGAVTVTTSQAFGSAQPVARNRAIVDQRAIESAKSQPFAPASVPTKQAVLDSGRATSVKPPLAVQTRPIVARTDVPMPPPAFERRRDAIQNNAGKPLSVAQVRQIQASVPPQPAAVRIAPPATPAARPVTPGGQLTPTERPPTRPAPPTPEAPRPAAAAAQPNEVAAARPVTPGSQSPSQDRLPTRPALPTPEATRAAPLAAHPSEVPVAPKPPSPAIANSVLERQHLQEQQQLRAQHDEEARRIQQQQDLEHEQFAKRQADEARQRMLDQQAQQQAQQLRQQQVQQQQQQLRAQHADDARKVQQQQELAREQLARQQADQAAKQALEQQHMQQTQQLLQKHAQEQQQLQERQQEQRRQQEAKPPPKNPQTNRPPTEKR